MCELSHVLTQQGRDPRLFDDAGVHPRRARKRHGSTGDWGGMVRVGGTAKQVMEDNRLYYCVCIVGGGRGGAA